MICRTTTPLMLAWLPGDWALQRPDAISILAAALFSAAAAALWERSAPGGTTYTRIGNVGRKSLALFCIISLLWMANHTPPVAAFLTVEPSAEFDGIDNGDEVPSQATLRGSVIGLEGRRLYFAVYAPGVGIFFQPGPDTIVDGRWEGNVSVGDARSSGATYRIALGAADEDADRFLALLLTQQRDTCRAWPEASYPQGWRTLASVTVTRGEWVNGTGPDTGSCPDTLRNARPSAPWASFMWPPGGGATVAREDIVQGEAGDLGSGHLYVLVTEKGSGTYWPQVHEIHVASNGTWSRDIYVGDQSSQGRTYNLIVGVADEAAHGTLARWLQESADRNYNHTPLAGLPEGFLPLNSHPVVRR